MEKSQHEKIQCAKGDLCFEKLVLVLPSKRPLANQATCVYTDKIVWCPADCLIAKVDGLGKVVLSQIFEKFAPLIFTDVSHCYVYFCIFWDIKLMIG